MLTIMRREFNSYFSSPIGFIYLAVFYILSGFFFFSSTLLYNTTDMSSLFSSLYTIIMFLIPILTMRLLSEEKKQKTDQLLITSPISLFSLIMGKYLSALLVFSTGIAVTILYAVVLASFTPIEWAVFLGHLIGLFLLGMALIAIGMFLSAITESQVIAAVSGFAVMLVLMMIDPLAQYFKTPFISSALSGLSFNSRYNSFTLGIIDFSNVLFFLSVAAVFIFFTIRVFEKRRWS